MRKLLFLIMILGLGLSSCKKEDAVKNSPEPESEDFSDLIDYSANPFAHLPEDEAFIQIRSGLIIVFCFQSLQQ